MSDSTVPYPLFKAATWRPSGLTAKATGKLLSGWEASLRTWSYQLVRNALHQLRSAPSRRPERNLPLSVMTSIANLQRSRTAPYQRTEVKDGLRALREALDPVDHEILILRLDRGIFKARKAR